MGAGVSRSYTEDGEKLLAALQAKPQLRSDIAVFLHDVALDELGDFPVLISDEARSLCRDLGIWP